MTLIANGIKSKLYSSARNALPLLYRYLPYFLFSRKLDSLKLQGICMCHSWSPKAFLSFPYDCHTFVFEDQPSHHYFQALFFISSGLTRHLCSVHTWISSTSLFLYCKYFFMCIDCLFFLVFLRIQAKWSQIFCLWSLYL